MKTISRRHTTATHGGLDDTFRPSPTASLSQHGANSHVRALAVQSDGEIVVGGDFTSVGGTGRNRIARLNANGSRDDTFTPGSGANGTVNAIAVQSDGKVIFGGAFTSVDGTTRNRLARLNSNGTLDTTFNPNVGGGDVHSIVVQPDGKIILGGAFTTVVGGQPTAQTRNRIARLNSDGTLDTFNPSITGGSSPVVYSIALQPNGRVIVGGDFTTIGGQARNRVARLDVNGSLDSTFNPGTGPNGLVRSVAADNDRVVIGGDFTEVGTSGRNRVARLLSSGDLDGSFLSGQSGVNAPVYSVAPQSDGRVTIAGEFTSLNGAIRNRIGRLHANGTLDETFKPSPTSLLTQHGANGIIRSLVVQWDGLFVIGGDFTVYTVPGSSQALSAGPRVTRIGGH